MNIQLPVHKYLALLTQKAVTNADTIQSKDFQEWLIHLKAERIATTNKINNLA